jgi:hypothetical protein
MIGSHDSFCFDGWVGSHDSSGYWTDNTKKLLCHGPRLKFAVSYPQGTTTYVFFLVFPGICMFQNKKNIYICINNIINNKRIDRAAAVVCVPVDRLAGAWVGCKYAMSTPPLVALLP